MEFKFRAVDKRPPNCFSYSSSSFNYLSGQAFRPNPRFDFNRSRPDQVQRELEKAQIREEIIASEIARRRALEAEVRREMMAEREMAAMHMARETGLSFEHRLTMRLDPRRPFMHHFSNHHRWRSEERLDLLPPLPPPPPPMLPSRVTEVLDTQMKATSEGNKNKLIILAQLFHFLFTYSIQLTTMWGSLSTMVVTEVVYVFIRCDVIPSRRLPSVFVENLYASLVSSNMAKPDPNRVVGAKRKTPPLAGELPLPLINLKKKPDEEWSCAVCQVSATSEKGLTEHLQGRKHKAKEARLRAERMEKNSNTNTTRLPKKPRKRPKVAETETDKKLTQLNKNVDGSDQKLEEREKLKNKEDELPVQKKEAERFRKKNGNANSLMKKHGLMAVDKVERTPEFRKKKRFKFWCKMCLVGAYSEVVMETHKKGKRHIARVQEHDENNAAAPATTTTTNTVTEQASPDFTQMPNDTDVVANEAKDKQMDVSETDFCNYSPVVN
ncbi:Uncharacterized protein TCM_037031 [Theobroma cacao]|uniref:U1-type domain-containing protein n=1 Tax=Theobroma cacao TaxID=3641 RepID=A0A061GI09_THECC|nr:Uncharacterized protein TCM_037031 [Theobroma cacao]